MKSKEEILAKRIVKFPEDPAYLFHLGVGSMTDESIKRNVYAAMEEYAAQFKDSPYQGSAADYEEVLKDHDRLVREIDVILNGEEGAAKQASLCDLVGQIKELKEVLVAAAVKRLMDDSAAAPAGDGEAIEILKELCWLKSHKDNVGKDSVYEQRQPEAWKRANDFLNRLTLTTK